MGPFSLTGQPNAMGGREVGGLANQLAAHMEIENPQHRDTRAAVLAFACHRRQGRAQGGRDVRRDGRRRIKAVWIMSTNPLVSLPDVNRARAALDACDLVVVSDCMRHTDTTRHGRCAAAGDGVGRKGRHRHQFRAPHLPATPFLPAPGSGASGLADRLRRRPPDGIPGFDYTSVAEIFREHASLSGFENHGARDFDLSALSTLDDRAYETLAPVQWPVTPDYPTGTPRLFETGRFFTPDRKARFIPVVPRPPKNATSREHPLVLNTGRIRDQWHTMTRTGNRRG